MLLAWAGFNDASSFEKLDTVSANYLRSYQMLGKPPGLLHPRSLSLMLFA